MPGVPKVEVGSKDERVCGVYGEIVSPRWNELRRCAT